MHSDIINEYHHFGATYSLIFEFSEGTTPILMIGLGISSCYATKILK